MPGNVFRSILTSNCRKADRFQAKLRHVQKGLETSQVLGEIECCQAISVSPALPDTGPPSTAGFVFLDGLFSVAGACRRICQLAVI
jgi:hypothetical protein